MKPAQIDDSKSEVQKALDEVRLIAEKEFENAFEAYRDKHEKPKKINLPS